MSDSFLHILPNDPSYVPPEVARQRAEAEFRAVLPGADEISSELFESPRFVDPGENFESVSCPACHRVLETGWWMEEIDRASATAFSDLSVQLPCCGATTTLNELKYAWPAGFARFVLSARNPGLRGWLSPIYLARLERELGCQLRQVLSYI